MRFGFSQFIASRFDMVTGWVTLRCDLIWIWLGTGGVRAGYIVGQVRLSVPVSIGELGGGSVNSGLAMGWSGTGPGFFWFGASSLSMSVGFDNAVLWYFFPSVDGCRRLAVRVCSGTDLVVVMGIYWDMGGEVVAIRLKMVQAETWLSFSQFGAFGSR